MGVSKRKPVVKRTDFFFAVLRMICISSKVQHVVAGKLKILLIALMGILNPLCFSSNYSSSYSE